MTSLVLIESFPVVAVDELIQELNRYPTANHVLKTEHGEARSLPALHRMARKRRVALESALRECIASAIQVHATHYCY